MKNHEKSIKDASSVGWLRHLRAISIFPFMVTVVIPVLLNRTSWLGSLITTASDTSRMLFFTLGLFSLAIGLGLFVATNFVFHTVGKGTLSPLDPPKQFVAVGLYRYCRNPMILGVLCILLGESLMFNSKDIFCWFLIFFLFNTVYFKLFEEPSLAKRFGAPYVDYKRSVPMWIPSFHPYNPKSP